jgi:para-nitrobenzyl esterase
LTQRRGLHGEGQIGEGGLAGSIRRLGAAIAAMWLCAGSALAAGVVHLRQGDIAGVTAGAVESFKGIAFAAPPVGDARWRPPGPAPSWSGVKTADAFGPICMQAGRGVFAVLPKSEDCLTLNVWRPTGAKAGDRLPVMVWIYGGAFINGAGSAPFYDGAHFAEQGVVLVTFNYRVGRFGFFAHPALDAGPGPIANYGLMDQIAALKWVRPTSPRSAAIRATSPCSARAPARSRSTI